MSADGSDPTRARRRQLVRWEEEHGITDPRVLDAMGAVPREAFVTARDEPSAYDERPLPIGEGQTISQPLIVATMTQALELTGGERVLEVGTGSGYQAAVLRQIVARVISVERLPGLAESARRRLASLGIDGVEVHVADGSLGWPGAGPYDAIVVTAGGPEIPPALLDQLAPGGRLVMPVGRRAVQHLLRARRSRSGELTVEDLGAVSFVPLIGEQGWSGP